MFEPNEIFRLHAQGLEFFLINLISFEKLRSNWSSAVLIKCRRLGDQSCTDSEELSRSSCYRRFHKDDGSNDKARTGWRCERRSPSWRIFRASSHPDLQLLSDLQSCKIKFLHCWAVCCTQPYRLCSLQLLWCLFFLFSGTASSWYQLKSLRHVLCATCIVPSLWF